MLILGKAFVKGNDQLTPISLQSLRIDTLLDFDLYVKVDDEYVLYRAADMPFSEKTRRALLDNNVEYLYVSADGRLGYQKYIEIHIRDIISDDTVSEATRTDILYDTARLLIVDLFKKPTLIGNIERGMSLVEATIMHSLRSADAFRNMLKVMAFNYTTYTHSVNVCAYTITLAQFVGIDNLDELKKLGLGALLHDVGMIKVPESILHKNGPLTAGERQLIEKHPQWGLEIILKTDMIPRESHYPIVQHHERECGSGYPHALKARDIHPYSKIVAIADVFDAMTTMRPYRAAKDSFYALKEMYDDKDAFDKELLEQFTRMMGKQEADE